MVNSKPRVAVLGEKLQGTTWLRYLIESNRFDIVAGVPRFSKKEPWWGEDGFVELLQKNRIPIIHREDLSHVDYDIIWSLMYGFIIEPEHIRQAKWFGLNLHESPLSRYRGCNGYSHAILEGAKTYGTTFHFLTPELDAGEMIDQDIFPIQLDETAKELYVRTIGYSNNIFRRNIPKVAEKSVKGTPYDVSKEPIRKRSSLLEKKEIHLDTEMEQIYRQVRALDFLPFEPPYFYYQKKKWYLFIDNSEGRKKYSDSDIPHRNSEKFAQITDLCDSSPIFCITSFQRPIIGIEENTYKKEYPLFLPQYSWISTKNSVQERH